MHFIIVSKEYGILKSKSDERHERSITLKITKYCQKKLQIFINGEVDCVHGLEGLKIVKTALSSKMDMRI